MLFKDNKSLYVTKTWSITCHEYVSSGPFPVIKIDENQWVYVLEQGDLVSYRQAEVKLELL